MFFKFSPAGDFLFVLHCFHSQCDHFQFLIAINARKMNRNEKNLGFVRIFYISAFLFCCTENLSMSYRRGFFGVFAWWGGLIYMRKTDTISNKRGSLGRGFNLCNFQEERNEKLMRFLSTHTLSLARFLPYE